VQALIMNKPFARAARRLGGLWFIWVQIKSKLSYLLSFFWQPFTYYIGSLWLLRIKMIEPLRFL